MHYSNLKSAQALSLGVHIIDIEVDLSRGLHSFSIVGLADKAVDEARDRIGAALKNSGFTSPKHTNQKIVISLAPAALKKEGTHFDLAMALGYLTAAGALSFTPEKKLFLGELALDGTVRKLSGTLAFAKKAREEGFEEIYVPHENAYEAALVQGITVFGVTTLAELVDHLNHNHSFTLAQTPQTLYTPSEISEAIDFSDIRSQENAKRGLLIAAAGHHNIALYGPPGTGKTMLAKAFRGILPPLSFTDALEVTAIHSLYGNTKEIPISSPPFRSPHHSSSYTALVGGGSTPRPGEITLAHKGVLFMDEFPEFDRRVIEALREPLEEKHMNITRTRGAASFPAHFILIAALNPCPCGYFGAPGKPCVCSAKQVQDYKRKISGPIMDRIDMWIEVGAVNHEELLAKEKTTKLSPHIKEKVLSARTIQAKRFEGNSRPLSTNSEMNVKELARYVALSSAIKELLIQSAGALNLSARAYHRVIKLARTIADIENSPDISEEHMLEALHYRPKVQDS